MEELCPEAARRGKFLALKADAQTLVCLDDRVYRYLLEKAQLRGVTVDDLVNDILKKSIELSWRLA